ncbi:MAG: Gfo/Idh/MocA family oxidoreductase [Flavobacteriaceae bacterium]|nr:Gfo/Idh/MocA family oxidoreductase [Muriicola sp.]NNC61226.1 Gfo/Idh/MocA family oxidoreductase [Eudoraea sp.]NNK20919.1 Gfo/Idh/MocA family oxidoreductase [Flavobacteriaceae bacterium]MBT8291531.1 Gfo/Idh/MocA family oxidoreductase [Muriicola sp.]NNK36735.1 Gfo/Idh/MocA family oxidoreductase [Eudoraea sp.]
MQRRKFIKNVTASSAVFSIVPSYVLGKGHVPPSDTLYVGAFGVGGRGSGVIRGLQETGKVKFVSFCDVDDRRAAQTYEFFPDVKRYKDFRKVYDKQLKDMDAVMVATPDHTHATIALPFMRAKKHAYVEKPLTHNIAEARMMTQVARENGIVTQMGNQGASSDGSRQAKEWINSGVIGKVERVDCWTNRPVWPQGLPLPQGKDEIPDGLDWDLWLGPAAKRDYNNAYLPFKWRGWWDFGTGALGDMGCHIMETPFGVLDLGYPTEAEASCTTNWVGDFVEADYSASCPASSIVRLKFNAPNHGKIDLNWYDGGIMPDLPDELKDEESIGDTGGGTVFYGTKGILVCDVYSRNARLLPSEMMGLFSPPAPTLARVEGSTGGHQRNWVEGCLLGTGTSSSFDRSGPLTEAVLMGNLAIKAFQYKELKEGKQLGDWDPYSYPGRRKIMWDGDAMRVTNFEKANEWVRGTYRKGWELK